MNLPANAPDTANFVAPAVAAGRCEFEEAQTIPCLPVRLAAAMMDVPVLGSEQEDWQCAEGEAKSAGRLASEFGIVVDSPVG